MSGSLSVEELNKKFEEFKKIIRKQNKKIEKLEKQNEEFKKQNEELKKKYEEVKNITRKQNKKIEELEKKIQTDEEDNINYSPTIFYDKNGIKHSAYPFKILRYVDETQEIILERQDKGFIGYTPEELKDNLEKKHPGEKNNNNNFTYRRYGISIDGSSSLYINPRCKKYKDRMNENIWYYAYADDKKQNEKFKKNNPIDSYIIVSVVTN